MSGAAPAVTAAPAAARLRGGPGTRPRVLRLLVALGAAAVGALLFDAGWVLAVGRIGRTSYWQETLGLSARVVELDTDLGWSRKPHQRWTAQFGDGAPVVYRTDEHGFRNPPGLTRADLVFIGDSFTEAAQVPEDETFVARLGHALGRPAVNLGASGYGPQQELRVLQRYGLAYRPRTVVWQVFEGNDLRDAAAFAAWEASGRRNLVPLAQRYANHSPLLRLARRLERRREPRQILRLTGGERCFLRLVEPYVPDQPARLPDGFRETRAAIERARTLCRERGIRFVVASVPMAARVLAPGLSFPSAAERERLLPGGRTSDPRDLGSALGALCRELDCPYLDLYPALAQQAALDNRRLFIPNDDHLDVAGHAVVARALRPLLEGPR